MLVVHKHSRAVVVWIFHCCHCCYTHKLAIVDILKARWLSEKGIFLTYCPFCMLWFALWPASMKHAMERFIPCWVFLHLEKPFVPNTQTELPFSFLPRYLNYWTNQRCGSESEGWYQANPPLLLVLRFNCLVTIALNLVYLLLWLIGDNFLHVPEFQELLF